MVTGISSIAFQAAPGKIPEKLRTKGQRTINQRVINGKTTEVLAKNETVKKSIPKKSKKKRVITTALLTLGTIVGLAVLGNKSSNYMATLGQKADDALMNQKWYQSFEKTWKNGKNKISEFFLNNKNKFIKDSAQDITETLTKRHAQPTMDLARGYGKGFSSIFSVTPVEILRTSLDKVEKQNPGQAIKSLEKLVGKEKAAEYFEKILGKANIADNKIFCEELTELIAKNFGAKDATGKIDTKKLLNIFKDMQNGKVNNVDFSEFTQIRLNESGLMGVISSWWPVNLIDKIGNKIAGCFGKTWKNIGYGNLGDSLVKFNAVNGSLAKTGAGSLVQQAITVPTESISNFVNDKSGMGVFLGLSVAGLYNNVQDAPKKKRTATVMNDYLGTIGSLAIVTPLAYKATYGLASLKNLEGKTWLTKALRGVGNFFGMGHKKIGLDGKYIEKTGNNFLNKLGSTGGHILRFALIMFVFNSIFGKPIRKGIEKIFGKPYDQNEEANKIKEQEALQQQLIAMAQAQGQDQNNPFSGMSPVTQ